MEKEGNISIVFCVIQCHVTNSKLRIENANIYKTYKHESPQVTVAHLPEQNLVVVSAIRKSMEQSIMLH